MKLLLALLATLVACRKKVIVGYYVPWGGVKANKLSYSKVTHINYAFALVNNETNPAEITFDAGQKGFSLPEVMTEARKHGVKVLISFGGWTGSQAFSHLVANKAHRTKFVENAMVFLKEPEVRSAEKSGPEGWGLDGLDIDWEYPGRKGDGSNRYTASFEKDDSDNYLLLLKDLRKAMDSAFSQKKLLTASVRVQPFDKDKVPMKDVSAFAEVFDFINIMAYDIMGTWDKTTGPNAPLDTGPEDKAQFSLSQSVDMWHQAGFPLEQITAGLAFYGHVHKTSEMMDGSNMYTPNTKKAQGDSSDAPSRDTSSDLPSGVIRYREMREKGVLDDKISPGRGYRRFFDNTTQTPYLFNKGTMTFISYDDVQSLKVKVDYAIEKKLRGVMCWDLTQDYQDELLNVLQSIRSDKTFGTAEKTSPASDARVKIREKHTAVPPTAHRKGDRTSNHPATGRRNRGIKDGSHRRKISGTPPKGRHPKTCHRHLAKDLR